MSEDQAPFDLIVVGLGAMGSAVAHYAQRRGMRVLGIDRHEPPHTLGSTHAETRITRLAVGEGPEYLPFVARSHELWTEMEEVSGETILHRSGGLIITSPEAEGDRWEDFAVASHRIAASAGIPFDLLEVGEARRRHPLLSIPDTSTVGFEPSGGVVMCERAVHLHLEMARRAGASIRTGETVRSVVPDSDGVTVTTDLGRHRSRRVVVATGPWFAQLAPPSLAALTTVTRQVVYWFEADDLDAFAVERFPFVIWAGRTNEDYVGLFPTPPGTTRAVKVLGEQFVTTTNPDAVERSVSAQEIAHFHESALAPKLSGVSNRCVRAEVCLYTNTPDDHFLVDHDPASDRVWYLSPCSGHGFKHSAGLGEAVAELMATGSSRLDLSPFRAERPSRRSVPE